jgi:hypothetical protein
MSSMNCYSDANGYRLDTCTREFRQSGLVVGGNTHQPSSWRKKNIDMMLLWRVVSMRTYRRFCERAGWNRVT